MRQRFENLKIQHEREIQEEENNLGNREQNIQGLSNEIDKLHN